MLKKSVKTLLTSILAPVAATALFVSTVGIQPASFFLWYQPQHPRR